MEEEEILHTTEERRKVMGAEKMKKDRKGTARAGKAVRIVTGALFAVLLAVNCLGCFGREDCTRAIANEYEYGDYKYAKEEKNGEMTATLIELMPSGRKEVLFLPSRVNKYRVAQLGRIGSGFMYTYHDCVIAFSVKKVYVPNTVEVISDSALSHTDNTVIILNRNRKLKLEDMDKKSFSGDSNCIVYDVEAHEDIEFDRTTVLKANVRYDRNPSAEEEYFFFIDNVERGSKLTPPPEEPTREGYTFAGWYKEAACVHAWDFEMDVTQTVLLEEGQEIPYEIQQQDNYVTTLYAKWTKK